MAFSLLWKFGGDAPHEPCFAEIVDEWAENARTNAVIETHKQFIDRKVIPLVLREVKNPFVAGGAEADKPWAADGDALFNRLIRVACDRPYLAGYPRGEDMERAVALVKRGCCDPLVRIFAAMEPITAGRYGRDEVSKKLNELEKSLGDQKGGFLWVLIGYYRNYIYQSYGGAPVRKDEVKKRFVTWMRNRKFAADDEVVLYHLAGYCGGFAANGVFDGMPEFSWAGALGTAYEELSEGRKSAGDGVSSSVTAKGWSDLNEKSSWAKRSVEEAEELASNRAETARLGLWVEGESRHGRAANFESWFRRLSSLRLDDPEGLKFFMTYRLYPRWTGDRQYREFLYFADACYSTGRHDTMLPYFYAELQCRYVRDAEIDPRDYFRGNPEITDRCLDVCLRQATNESTCAYARIMSPLVGSYIAFNAGRYDQTNLFSRIDMNITRMYAVGEVFPDYGAIYLLKALALERRAFFAELCRMFDRGQYRELLEAAEKERSVITRPGGLYAEGQFLGGLIFNARMKRDFNEGKDVVASAPPGYPGWGSAGWWRSGDCVWDSYPNAFNWEHSLTWAAELPWTHELEFSLTAKPKTEGRHVLVVSRFQHEACHYRPLNRLPYFTFIWEKDRTGLLVDNDYYHMFDVPSAAAIWTAANSPSRKIRIVCDGERISVFLDEGETPVWSSTEYAGAIRRARPFGFARFRGDNVRLSGVRVRKPKSIGKAR